MSHWIIVLLLGVIEGITEFLPVSSTGHLLIAERLLHARQSDLFNVVIQAGAVLARMIPDLRAQQWDGVITAAYGDPGLDALRAGLDCPVTGIGEASMLAAAGVGAFAVVTTTPELAASITAMAERSGFGTLFQGVFLTRGDAVAVTNDPALLVERLEEACHEALGKSGIKPASLIIGGGPLALAARALADRVPVRLIEPVPAAIRRIGLMVLNVAG
jgi:Asp/Glu/hydantoin racemase